MNPQSTNPTGPSPFNGGIMSNTPKGSLTPVLIAVLSLGIVAFAILSIVFYTQAATAKKNADSQKASTIAEAKENQRKADEAAATTANGLPFRSYVAPASFGSFEIKFPKDWSSYAVENSTGTQVNLALNPQFIRRTGGTDELVAARITLQERSKDQFLATYKSPVQHGILKQTETTISGQKAYDLTGKFPDKRTIRQVVVPVRDKVIVFTTENTNYASQFSEILAQAKIIP